MFFHPGNFFLQIGYWIIFLKIIYYILITFQIILKNYIENYYYILIIFQIILNYIYRELNENIKEEELLIYEMPRENETHFSTSLDTRFVEEYLSALSTPMNIYCRKSLDKRDKPAPLFPSRRQIMATAR